MPRYDLIADEVGTRREHLGRRRFADGLIPRIAEYRALIKSTREALDQSTGKTVEEFKKKIPEPGDPAEFFKWITGLAFDTASATGKELTNGTKDPLSSVAKTNMVSTLWDSVGALLGMISATTPHRRRPPGPDSPRTT